MTSRYFAFISYGDFDRSWVAKLQHDLEQSLDHSAQTVDAVTSRRVFLDQVDLRSGRTRVDQVEEALDSSERLILVVSPEALNSKWVRIEWQSFLARRAEEDIFLVRIAGAEIPTFLEPFQWVDFGDLEGVAYDEQLRQLVGDLTRRSRGDSPAAPEGLLGREHPPRPAYASSEVRDLSLALKRAYRLRAETRAAGDSVSVLNETIVGLKRQLRAGPQLQAGDCLLEGRFELLEAIGEGGFATVWKAYDQSSHAVVALKILHSEYSSDQSRRDRFFRGARQMTHLRHPGIVSVNEPKCEEGGYQFFSMEYLAGGDFRRAILEGRFSLDDRFQVIQRIGAALSHAHVHGVIHRDVKPANILLDLEGLPKLTDFDLVWAADTTGGTRTGMLGTFLYAAPEMLRDARQTSELTDVFGLGMTAVFAVHGADLPMDVFYEPTKFLSRLDCGNVLRDVLSRAIHRDEAERWSSIDELCLALDLESQFPARGPRGALGARREVQGTGSGDSVEPLAQIPELRAGDKLLDGRFRLLEPMGKPGVALTWKAFDRVRQSMVALRMLHSEYSENPDLREEFFRGAHQMSCLEHPGIVSVLEIRCEDRGYQFFTMEYFAGGDLREAIHDGGKSLEQRLQIIQKIGEALSFAHRQGTIHCDVRPSKILFGLDGNPKLAVPGRGRIELADGRVLRRMRSFRYVAPEVLHASDRVSDQADVYGLGMTAIFALGGLDLPLRVFAQPTQLEVQFGAQEPLGRVLSKAIRRDQAERWSSIAEFCSALHVASLPAPRA